VYRWLRCQRDWAAGTSDIYITLTWPSTFDGEADDATTGLGAALYGLDLACKTLNTGPGLLELRTRGWSGRERHKRSLWAGRRDPTDRSDGLRYAQMLAWVLRAAHRAKIPLEVRNALERLT
jgi:hypothetical protein